MKLIIQIPCHNEELTLPITLASLPRQVEGFDSVEWLIIDDGSLDGTVEVARQHGVDHIIINTRNQGLARTFMIGLDACLQRGADVIVHTDADNQYDSANIPKLTAPVVCHKAEIVIGERPVSTMDNFSRTKKILNRFGSWVVRKLSVTEVADAPSGFRAYSRNAAQRLNVFSSYSYTLETIIQAGQNNLSIEYVPICVNPDLRPSRLVKSIPDYVLRSCLTIIRIFVIYKPFRFFGSIGLISCVLGSFVGLRFLWFYFNNEGDGHIQSLILSNILIGIGFQTILVAFIADLLAANRKLLEELCYKQRQQSSSQ